MLEKKSPLIIFSHIRSINNFFMHLTFFLHFFSKWPPVVILDDRKSHLITFLTISDQYTTFFSNGCSGNLSARFFQNSIGTSLYGRSLATSNMKLIGASWINLWSAQAFHHIVTKWPSATILVFRFSPKSIGFFHSRSSMAVSNMNLIPALIQMTAGGHFEKKNHNEKFCMKMRSNVIFGHPKWPSAAIFKSTTVTWHNAAQKSYIYLKWGKYLPTIYVFSLGTLRL